MELEKEKEARVNSKQKLIGELALKDAAGGLPSASEEGNPSIPAILHYYSWYQSNPFLVFLLSG